MRCTVGVTGLNAGENPQPGPGVIRSLRRSFNDIEIIGLAYGPYESSIYVDDAADFVYLTPCLSAGVDAFIARLEYIQSSHPIDLLIPTLDAEILTCIQIRERLTELGIRCVLPSLDSFLCRGKDRLSELVEGSGAHVPKSISVSSADALVAASKDLCFPVMVKGLSYDAVKAESSFELAKAFNKIMYLWGGPVIVQEFIRGEEFDIVAVGDGVGGVEASCSIRKSVRSEKGKGFGGIVIDNPELSAIGRNLIEKLKWDGPCELEFVQDAADGKFYLIEINPRFPAWIDFPSTFGYNLPKLIVDRLPGADPDPLPECCPTGYFFLRHAVDVLGRVEDLGELIGSGEMCDKNRCEGNKG